MVKTNNQKNALAIGEIFNATQPSTQLNLALLDLTLAVPLVDSERVRLLDTLIDGAKHAINKLTDVTDEFKELDFADSLTTRIAQLPSTTYYPGLMLKIYDFMVTTGQYPGQNHRVADFNPHSIGRILISAFIKCLPESAPEFLHLMRLRTKNANFLCLNLIATHASQHEYLFPIQKDYEEIERFVVRKVLSIDEDLRSVAISAATLIKISADKFCPQIVRLGDQIKLRELLKIARTYGEEAQALAPQMRGFLAKVSKEVFAIRSQTSQEDLYRLSMDARDVTNALTELSPLNKADKRIVNRMKESFSKVHFHF